jgi:hypothetical protein
MKRKFIYVSVFMACFSLTLTSCGGSDKDDDKTEMDAPSADATATAGQDTGQDAASEELNLETLTTSKDASDKYKEMISEYAEIAKNGTDAEKEAFKVKLDELENYAKDKFPASELKAMLSLTKLAVQLEAGKLVDLDAAYATYGKALEESMKLLNSNEDVNKAMKDAKGQVDKAMKGAGKDVEKAMQDAMNQYGM